MTEPLITVIVPVYKVEPYLRRCVDSILDQTYRNLEIILVDDGSPDNCGLICDEYAEKDSRVRVIHKENGGLSDARNAGLDILSGEYIGFVDSDDWIEPQMYESLYGNLIRFQADMAFGGMVNEKETGGATTVVKTSDYGPEPFSESNIQAMRRYFLGSWSVWDKLCKASLYDGIRFPVGEINEDEAIVLQLLDQCGTVCYTNEIFYHYMKRLGSGSITASAFSEKKLVAVTHFKNNYLWIREHCPQLTAEAWSRYLGGVIWALNNMTADRKGFSDEIARFRKILKGMLHKKDWERYLPGKEAFRAILLAYFYIPYTWAVRILGKHYT